MPEHDDDPSAALPKTDTEPMTIQLAGMLGEFRADVRAVREQGSRMEAQNVQLLEQGNTQARELQKLASEVVDLRSEFKKHEDDHGAHGHLPPMRAPAASITNEVKATHDSIRAVAEETAKQTPMLEAALKAATSAANVPASLSQSTQDTRIAAKALSIFAVIMLVLTLLKEAKDWGLLPTPPPPPQTTTSVPTPAPSH